MTWSRDEEASRVRDDELEYDSDLIYRHRGSPFTGIGYEHTPTGRSEITYQDGYQQGPSRDWSGAGRLRAEGYFFQNTLHGWQRTYGDDGAPIVEELYLYAVLARRIDHQPDGPREWTLPEDDERRHLLERFRSERRWPEPPPG